VPRGRQRAEHEPADPSARSNAAALEKSSQRARPKRLALRTSAGEEAHVAEIPDIGDPAPDFTLPSIDGPFRLYDRLRESAVLLVFYPKDDTLVCTRQLCNYRDHLSDFAQLQIEVVGVNHDSVGSHEQFATRYKLPFTLCSDVDRSVCRAYGVLSSRINTNRALVVVGEDKRVWWRHSELRLFRRDADELLEVIRELRAEH